MTSRVLGIDPGEKRTGIAVSDPTGFLAHGVGTLREGNKERLAERIAGYAAEYDVRAVVLGYPVNMNGSRSNRADSTELLARLLAERLSVPVYLLDERCTTLQAHRILSEEGVRGRKRKAAVDTLSAEIILQNFLDKEKNGGTLTPFGKGDGETLRF